MEHHKISKLSNDSTVSKCDEKMDLSKQFIGWSTVYSVKKNITFKTPMLILALCDYCDAYIVVKRRIIIEGNSNAN